MRLLLNLKREPTFVASNELHRFVDDRTLFQNSIIRSHHSCQQVVSFHGFVEFRSLELFLDFLEDFHIFEDSIDLLEDDII